MFTQHRLPLVFLILSGLLATVLFSSCGPDNANCTKLWTLDNPGDHKTEIHKGLLEIETTHLDSASTVTFYQEALAGNFVAFLDINEFNRGVNGNGAYLRFFIRNGDTASSAIAFASIGDVSPAGIGLQLGAVVDATGLSPEGDSTHYVEATSDISSLSIFRTGELVTVTAEDSEGHLIEFSSGFNSEPVEIGFSLGTNSETVDGKTTAIIDGFRISTIAVGGTETNVETDDFECISWTE